MRYRLDVAAVQLSISLFSESYRLGLVRSDRNHKRIREALPKRLGKFGPVFRR